MTKTNELDMLHGPLLGKILKFAMPFAASSVLQQLFNSVDVAVVGRFACSEALAAVGANTFLINLMINFFVGISIGASVIIANHVGQRDTQSIRHAVSTSAALAIVSGVFLLFAGLILSRPVLLLMGTPHNIIDDAVLYLRIYFLGVPFVMIYNFGASILRSKGDTRRPLYVLMVAGVINTVLNLILVINFHMSVMGVAIATDVSNLFCAAIIVWILRKEDGAFKLNIRKIHIYNIELKRILQIGVPAGVQSMVFSLSNIFVQSAINGYGSSAVAGASVSQTFDSYCYFLLGAFSSAAVTFIGQNYGAGHLDRCKRVFRICLVGGFLVCFVSNMLFMLFDDEVLSLFTTDRSVIYYAKLRMQYVLVFQSIATFYDIPSSALRAYGHSLEPALLTIFGTCVIRVVWVMLICPIWPGFVHLMICYPVTWIITSILVCLSYYFHTYKIR